MEVRINQSVKGFTSPHAIIVHSQFTIQLFISLESAFKVAKNSIKYKYNFFILLKTVKKGLSVSIFNSDMVSSKND